MKRYVRERQKSVKEEEENLCECESSLESERDKQQEMEKYFLGVIAKKESGILLNLGGD